MSFESNPNEYAKLQSLTGQGLETRDETRETAISATSLEVPIKCPTAYVTKPG